MISPWYGGYIAGFQGRDSRSCPYEESDNVRDWYTGYYIGLDDRDKTPDL
jgi:ribosome modulation factor